jgi:sugar lactone lactonase YvrE
MKQILAAILLALLGWLLFWPVPIDPVAWDPPEAPELEGRYAQNERLKDITLVAKGVGTGGEDVLVDDDGHIYTGYNDGRLVRLEPDGSNPDVLARTGGRPLGLDFDSRGRVIVADGYKGLLRVDKSGAVTTLAKAAEGQAFGFTNNVTVADDGMIFFTDASSKFGPELQARDDILEHRGHGRLLRYNPQTGETRALLTDLQFANGVALTPDEDAILVAQTGSYNILRYHRSGDRAGEHDVLIDNLPGLPDNIRSDGEDTIWIALYAPRNPALDALGPWPFLREMAFRLPRSWQPQPAPHAFVLGMTPDGEITHNLQYKGENSYHPVTGVDQHDNRLYLGSLTNGALAVYELPQQQPGR